MSGYLVSASGLSSRISERFVEGHMSDEPGLSAADVLRLSVCSDCFSDKHLFGVARSHQTTHFPARHLNERSGRRSVFGPLFFSPSGVSSWLRERDVPGKMLDNHGTLLKSVCC